MKLITEETLARAYYHIKPFMPRRLQILIRRAVARHKRTMFRDSWPIDPGSGDRPPGFTGWPGGKRFAVVLTHDVDTARGVARCKQLMALERDLGFRSSFNFVAHDYHLPEELRHKLVREGFEVGVHGLEHNRKLYESASTFAEQAGQINGYLKDWGAVGFRSPCVYHNFEWLHALDITYEASAFDTDPFEPQSDALGTIFPVHQRGVPGREYVVLPYTLPQDFTTFILFRENDISIWKQKLRWIAEHGGMALLISHPDYMSFDGPPRFDEYSPQLYQDLLKHIQGEYRGEYWHPLPREVASFWSSNVADHAGGDAAEAAVTATEQGAAHADFPCPDLIGPDAGQADDGAQPAGAFCPLPGVREAVVGLPAGGLAGGGEAPVARGQDYHG